MGIHRHGRVYPYFRNLWCIFVFFYIVLVWVNTLLVERGVHFFHWEVQSCTSLFGFFFLILILYLGILALRRFTRGRPRISDH